MSLSTLIMILTAPVIAIDTSYYPPRDSGLEALEASELYTLRSPVDSTVWLEYERFLLSQSRVTPLLLYFTPALTCSDDKNEDDSVVGQEEEVLAFENETCWRHQKLVEATVKLAAKMLSNPKPLVVRIDVSMWPKMLHYHLMSTTPSLLWIPGRATGRFQRYPHVETNFLDLRVNGALYDRYFAENVTMGEKSNVERQCHLAKETAAKNITAFVRLCQERSGYLTRNANGQLIPRVLVDSNDDAFSVLELIPILAFLTFIALVINDNRAFVLNLVQTRLFWFILCLIVTYVALSGFFHAIIYRQAWFYFSEMHGFVFLYPNSRRQFVLEGLVNGTWSLWMSLGLMSISDVLPTLRSYYAQKELLRWSLFLVAISYLALHFTFLMKYPWLS
ncbi:Oligosaccharyl transferase complex, subunit OST3/OST6 [Plasmopara halstedii]|uniref:Oligosaccharyl transferase complex, subunit OST3/OST6 n=1 Tax=Plasmopara halstedii TaxID=4781 RepID=A0A0P1AA76_PLAHL|nr:Oligosaccharyl transferase complex, subunit OST3/OST6 [Plasmopara halstedii]CEG37657.1 Oligosaccharyl transferase complex, subunit OST3/OST6 [Plasmopara halstedii]|eukprot:XP_024574026.1 Oligosaccharyl transferase complex, subunit OST3/OST6 [Plasmopara halstedii]